jgi:hypothetical protein
MKTYQIILFIILSCGSFALKAQTPILHKDAIVVWNDQAFYPAGANYQHWYYLPQALTPQKDKQGVPQLLFMKYSGEGDSGAILHAIFDFSLTADDEQKALNNLRTKVAAASSLQVYPFYHYFMDKKSNQLSFTFSITDSRGSHQHTITNISGQLNSSGAILSARLPGEVSDQIWESLEDPSQIVSLSTETSFLQKTPEKDLYINLNLQKLAQFAHAILGEECTPEAFYHWVNMVKEEQPHLLTIKGRDLRSFSATQQEELLNEKLVALLTDARLERWGEKQQFEKTSSKKIVIINGVVQKEEKEESKSESKKSDTEWQLRKPEELPDAVLKYFLDKTAVREVPHKLQLNLTALYNNERLSNNLFKQK